MVLFKIVAEGKGRAGRTGAQAVMSAALTVRALDNGLFDRAGGLL